MLTALHLMSHSSGVSRLTSSTCSPPMKTKNSTHSLKICTLNLLLSVNNFCLWKWKGLCLYEESCNRRDCREAGQKLSHSICEVCCSQPQHIAGGQVVCREDIFYLNFSIKTRVVLFQNVIHVKTHWGPERRFAIYDNSTQNNMSSSGSLLSGWLWGQREMSAWCEGQ